MPATYSSRVAALPSTAFKKLSFIYEEKSNSPPSKVIIANITLRLLTGVVLPLPYSWNLEGF